MVDVAQDDGGVRMRIVEVAQDPPEVVAARGQDELVRAHGGTAAAAVAAGAAGEGDVGKVLVASHSAQAVDDVALGSRVFVG